MYTRFTEYSAKTTIRGISKNYGLRYDKVMVYV